MASTDNEVPAPIIVKKVIKKGGGHHGGAWKVAYADFVTAMMAFFLLMWLLNMTTKEEKNAISNYFDPSHPKVSSVMSGSGGVLGGMTVSPDGAQVSNVQNVVAPEIPRTPKPTGQAEGEDDQNNEKATDQNSNLSQTSEDSDDSRQDGLNILDEIKNIEQANIEQLKQIIEDHENENFEAIKQKILEEVSKSPELADLLDHLMIDITPEGLRIQIVDKDGRSMFPIGKSEMFDFMQKLVAKVTQVIIPQPNQISVRGHTDGKPYPPGAKYNNWNLSADRAIASHRAMIDSGLQTERVNNIAGKADREHLLPDEPLSPRNRRISIILLREKLVNDEEIKEKAASAIKEKAEQAVISNNVDVENGEDIEDIPELDQVIEGATNFTIENGGKPTRSNEVIAEEINESEPTDIGDEIKKFKSQRAQKNKPRSLPAPIIEIETEQETQVLEF